MEVHEVLEGMLDILNEKEWIQGTCYKLLSGDRRMAGWFPPEKVAGVCLEGACHVAMFEAFAGSGFFGWGDLKARVADVVLAAARELFPEKTPFWMDAMYQLNDGPYVNREDIILIVKSALEKARPS